MARLTITLSDQRHRALKEAAARRNRTIGQLVEKSLEFYGIKGAGEAAELVAAARARAALRETDAIDLAVDQTAAERGR